MSGITNTGTSSSTDPSSASGVGFNISTSTTPVDSFGAVVSLGSGVNSVGGQVSLTTDNVANSILRATLTEVPPQKDQIKLSLREKGTAPKSQAVVFNDLGSSQRVFDVGRAKQMEIDSAYQELRAKVAPDAEKVNFNLSQMTVWYRKTDGTEYVKDLQEIVEQDKDCMEKFLILDDLVRPVWGAPLRGQFSIESGKKSTSNGLRPMQRGNEALNAMPKDKYADSAKLALKLFSSKEPDLEKQKAALKRITAIEAIINPLVNIIETDLSKLTTNSLSDDVERKKRELEALLRKLQVDRFGLYVAAAFIPQLDLSKTPPSYALSLVKEAARSAQAVLQEAIDKERDRLIHDGVKRNLPGWIPGFIRGKARPVPENTAYSVDAAALIFSSLSIPLARQGALAFWKQHELFQKMDCLEDELIRFTIANDPSIPQIDNLIARISDKDLKGRMEKSLGESKQKAREIMSTTLPEPSQSLPSTTPSSSTPSSPAVITNDARVDHLKDLYRFG